MMETVVYEKLTDDDLRKNQFQYDLATLEWNIKHSALSLRVLSRYQRLSPYICAKYVVFGGKNEQYADCTEDAWLCTGDILNRQPHITLAEMLEAHKLVDEEDQSDDDDEDDEEEDVNEVDASANNIIEENDDAAYCCKFYEI